MKHRLKRLPDWERRLIDITEKSRKKPFVRGKRDCGLWVCDVIKTITGVDLGVDYRGVYKNLDGAKLALKRDGGSLYHATIKKLGLPMNNVNFAQRGDLVMLRGDEGLSLGIVDNSGAKILGYNHTGLLSHPLSRAIKAWKIG